MPTPRHAGTTETIRPWNIVTTTSARSSTSSSSVDEKITAVPLRAASRTRLWISARPPTSTPRVGSSSASSAVPSSCSARPSSTFCWLPPLRLATGEPSRVDGDARHRRELPRRTLDPAPQQNAEPAQPAEPRDGQVALDRLAEEEPLALAVVRDVEHAGRGGAPRRVEENLLAPDFDRPGGVRHEPAERAEDRARARADLPGEARDDAALERERDILDAARHGEPRRSGRPPRPNRATACSCSTIVLAPSISPSMLRRSGSAGRSRGSRAWRRAGRRAAPSRGRKARRPRPAGARRR